MAGLRRVSFVARLQGVAGPAAFQRRLAAGLEQRGIEVGYGPQQAGDDPLLLLGGTRRLAPLVRARRRGVAVVQRLDGMNWIHRRRRTGVRHFLRAEFNNLLLSYIRDRLATAVVYQSRFARGWWERARGAASVPARVIWNGVPLNAYSPRGTERPPTGAIRLLVVEANLAGGYEIGLDWARGLAERLARRNGPVEVWIAGTAPPSLRSAWANSEGVEVRWLGSVPPEEIPALDRSAHFLFASDLHPACPNSVIEALACGLPAVSFDTGALPELVTEAAGRLARYGGDPWKVDPPDLDGLAEAAQEVLRHQPRFRRGARLRAEEAFGVDGMVEAYLEVLGG
jgi:glycosyltransferase involved in cell wall biosynthesis